VLLAYWSAIGKEFPVFKWTKRIVTVGLVVGLIGGVCFGTGFASYLRSSKNILKTVVKDSIPVEFEIQRARDLLEDLIPEMHANLRIVAAEEVEVANLEREIERQRESIAGESGKLRNLRSTLDTQLTSYQLGGRRYERVELVEDLSRRFEHLRTAEMLLDGKKDLLRNRQRSLDAALRKLEKTRLSRVELQSQIEALEGQFRLVEAQSASSGFSIDETKLARTEKVISELKTRLAVAQRVLAREAQFIELIPVDVPNEASVVKRVDAYFAKQEPVSSSLLVAPAK
jgi:hypothetical protein